jgi:hypothetical protein
LLSCLIVQGCITFVCVARIENVIVILNPTPPLNKSTPIFTGFGRGIIPAPRRFEIFGVELIKTSWAIGIILVLCISALVIKLVVDKRIKENAVALMLIGFTIISILGAMRLRIVTADASYMFGDRYYRFLVPAFLGALLLAFDLWKRKPVWPATLAFSCLVVGHLTMTGLVSSHTWIKVLPSIESYFAKWDDALLEYDPAQDTELANRYGTLNGRCRNNYCDHAIAYLREEELSTFRTADSPGKRD